MFNFSSKPIVAYVAYEPFGIEYLNRFLDKYNQFSSGLDHDLLICFKQFRDKNLIEDWKKKYQILLLNLMTVINQMISILEVILE